MSALENADDAREWEAVARRLEVAQRMADALAKIIQCFDACANPVEAIETARAAHAEWEATR